MYWYTSIKTFQRKKIKPSPKGCLHLTLVGRLTWVRCFSFQLACMLSCSYVTFIIYFLFLLLFQFGITNLNIHTAKFYQINCTFSLIKNTEFKLNKQSCLIKNTEFKLNKQSCLGETAQKNCLHREKLSEWVGESILM